MKKKNNDETIHVGKLFAALFPYRRTFAIVCALSLLAGIVFWELYPKQYKTTATMLLVVGQQDMASQMRSLQVNGLASMLSGDGSGINIDDQMTIVSSTEVLGKTIRDQALQVSIYQYHRLKIKELYDDAPIVVDPASPLLDSLTQTIEAELKFESSTRLSLLFDNGNFDSFQTETKDLPATFATPLGEITLQLAHPTATLPPGTLHMEIAPFVKQYEYYRKEVTIRTSNLISNILELSIESSCPPRNHALLTSLMENYNTYITQKKKTNNQRNDHFIEEQINEIGKKLSDYEYQIENYKKRNKLTDIETDVKLTLASAETYKGKQVELEIQRKLMEYVLDYLNSPANSNTSIPVVLTGADKESPIASGISAYNILIAEQTRLKQVSGERNPALVSVNRQIEQQRKNLTETIETYRQSIDLSIKEVSKTNHQYRQWISSLPSNEREFVEIKRQQTVKETLLLFLLQKRAEFELSNNPYQQPGQILETPHHSFKHTFPKGSIILPVSLILGLVLSLLTVFIQEFGWRKTASMRILKEECLLPLFMERGTVEELASRLLRSSYKVIQLIEDTPNNGASALADALLQRLAYMQKRGTLLATSGAKGPERKGYNSLTFPPGLSPYSNQAILLFEQLKAENDILVLLTPAIDQSSLVLDLAPMADLSLCVCRPNITLKSSVEQYSQWGETNLFHRLEIIVNPLET